MAQVNGIQESTADMLAKLDQLGGPHKPALPRRLGMGWKCALPVGQAHRLTPGRNTRPNGRLLAGRIKDAGGIRYQFEDVTDIAPTILEAAGLPEPVEVNGVKQQRVDGISMLSTFASASAPGQRTSQYFEMMGNRAIYNDGWMASARSGMLPWLYGVAPESMMQQPWELYHLSETTPRRTTSRQNIQTS